MDRDRMERHGSARYIVIPGARRENPFRRSNGFIRGELTIVSHSILGRPGYC
jgi:hypothetical protein